MHFKVSPLKYITVCGAVSLQLNINNVMSVSLSISFNQQFGDKVNLTLSPPLNKFPLNVSDLLFECDSLSSVFQKSLI